MEGNRCLSDRDVGQRVSCMSLGVMPSDKDGAVSEAAPRHDVLSDLLPRPTSCAWGKSMSFESAVEDMSE